MFNWFGKKDIKKEVIPAVEIAPVIGEPVLSIIESMKDINAWSFDGYQNIYTLTHKENRLALKFYVDFSYTYCGEPHVDMGSIDWPTKDEQKAIGQALLSFIDESKRIKDEYTHMVNQLERMKFMEAFVKEEK